MLPLRLPPTVAVLAIVTPVAPVVVVPPAVIAMPVSAPKLVAEVLLCRVSVVPAIEPCTVAELAMLNVPPGAMAADPAPAAKVVEATVPEMLLLTLVKVKVAVLENVSAAAEAAVLCSVIVLPDMEAPMPVLLAMVKSKAVLK